MKGVADVPIAPTRNGRVCPRQVRNPSGPAARSWKDVSATPARRCVGAHQCVRPLQPKHDAARVMHSLVCVKRAEGPAHRRRPLGRRSPGTRCPGLTPGICSQATAGCAPLLGALAIAPPSEGPAVDPGVHYLYAAGSTRSQVNEIRWCAICFDHSDDHGSRLCTVCQRSRRPTSVGARMVLLAPLHHVEGRVDPVIKSGPLADTEDTLDAIEDVVDALIDVPDAMIEGGHGVGVWIEMSGRSLGSARAEAQTYRCHRCCHRGHTDLPPRPWRHQL